LFTIKPIDISNDPDLKGFCAKLRTIPGAEFRPEKDCLPDLALRAIEKQLVAPGSGLLGLFGGDESLAGMAGYGMLDWDSTHFGYKMGRVFPFWVNESAGDAGALLLLEEALSDLIELGLEHAYLRIDPFDNHSLRAACALGFFPVDTITEYLFDFSRSPIPVRADGLEMALAGPNDKEELIALTRETFDGYLGRFHVDPGFFSDRATEMYVKWLQKSLDKTLADEVLVAKIDGRIAGFLTMELKSEESRIAGLRMGQGVLAGVAPFARGKGVYKAVINESLHWFKDRADKVKVSTQVNNTPVQNAWTALGFRLVNSYHTLHYWNGD
jgi:RimJ/RimL family protein N-acetyltransferase